MNFSRAGKSFFTIFLLIILTACGKTAYVTHDVSLAALKEVNLEPKEQQVIEKEITISAVGDILIHSPIYQDAKVNDGYDFTPMLEKVKPYLSKSSIAVANQETMIGGEELGLSSYPSFNSPTEVGDALKDVGIDVVTIANNHTLDRGEEAIMNAIHHWETIDMMYSGAYKNELDKNNLRVYETDEGISVAFLSYTYGTNGIPVPNGKDFLVNLIDKENMQSEIEAAKGQADVVVLSLHFGNEYERMPSESQKKIVQFAADQGVHAVIGHHPHVLQPASWVTGKEGNKMFVIYSLGNFLSNQQDLYQRIGGIINFTIKKTTKGEEETIEIHSPSFLPTYVTFQPNYSDYKVVPMYQLTDEELIGVEKYYQEIKNHMSQWMPELEFVEEKEY